MDVPRSLSMLPPQKNVQEGVSQLSWAASQVLAAAGKRRNWSVERTARVRALMGITPRGSGSSSRRDSLTGTQRYPSSAGSVDRGGMSFNTSPGADAGLAAAAAGATAAAAQGRGEELLAEVRVLEGNVRSMRQECTERWVNEQAAVGKVEGLHATIRALEQAVADQQAKIQHLGASLDSQSGMNRQLMARKEEVEWQLMAALAKGQSEGTPRSALPLSTARHLTAELTAAMPSPSRLAVDALRVPVAASQAPQPPPHPTRLAQDYYISSPPRLPSSQIPAQPASFPPHPTAAPTGFPPQPPPDPTAPSAWPPAPPRPPSSAAPSPGHSFPAHATGHTGHTGHTPVTAAVEASPLVCVQVALAVASAVHTPEYRASEMAGVVALAQPRGHVPAASPSRTSQVLDGLQLEGLQLRDPPAASASSHPALISQPLPTTSPVKTCVAPLHVAVPDLSPTKVRERQDSADLPRTPRLAGNGSPSSFPPNLETASQSSSPGAAFAAPSTAGDSAVAPRPGPATHPAAGSGGGPAGSGVVPAGSGVGPAGSGGGTPGQWAQVCHPGMNPAFMVPPSGSEHHGGPGRRFSATSVVTTPTPAARTSAHGRA